MGVSAHLRQTHLPQNGTCKPGRRYSTTLSAEDRRKLDGSSCVDAFDGNASAVGHRGQAVAVKVVNQVQPFRPCRFVPSPWPALPNSPGRRHGPCRILRTGQGNHLEIWRAETEFLHEFAESVLGRCCDHPVNRQTERRHDLRRVGDSFCGHSDVAGRVQDLAEPEDKSQVSIDNEDSFQPDQPNAPSCNLHSTDD